MKKRTLAIIAAVGVIAIQGCASRSGNVAATYVSPMEYSGYSCEQIRARMRSVSSGVMRVSGQQDDAASRDAWATGVGLVLFWPALFFITPDDQSDQLARLKGQYEALEEAAIQNNCDVADELRIARERREVEMQRKQASQESDYRLPGQSVPSASEPPIARQSAPAYAPATASTTSGYARETSTNGNSQRIADARTQEFQSRVQQARMGEASFQVEQSARNLGCHLQGAATLLSTNPPAEIYQQKCLGGIAMIFRCEYRQCIELQ